MFGTHPMQVGGTEEYKIVEAIKDGSFHKPIIAWCIGTCARMFTSEVRAHSHKHVLLTASPTAFVT